MRLGAASRSCPGARRTTQCSLESPAWARLPLLKVSHVPKQASVCVSSRLPPCGQDCYSYRSVTCLEKTPLCASSYLQRSGLARMFSGPRMHFVHTHVTKECQILELLFLLRVDWELQRMDTCVAAIVITDAIVPGSISVSCPRPPCPRHRMVQAPIVLFMMYPQD